LYGPVADPMQVQTRRSHNNCGHAEALFQSRCAIDLIQKIYWSRRGVATFGRRRSQHLEVGSLIAHFCLARETHVLR
jgi:hypothetical protein